MYSFLLSMLERRVRSYAQDEESRTVSFRNTELADGFNDSRDVTVLTYHRSGLVLVA